MKEISETIVYIGGFELPDKNAAAHRVLNNAKIFRKQGKRVVFIGVDKELSYNLSIFDTKKEVQGFWTFSVPYPRESKQWVDYLTNVKGYIRVLKTLKSVKGVIFYNFQAVAMGRIMSYCRKNNIKCYADITEWRSAKGERIIYRILKDSDTWWRMHILHKKMDGLIVISRYLENYYKKCKNVVCIPALTDLSEKKWENEYDKSTDILYLVYAGNPGLKDKIDILIEALKGVKRAYCLDIIGITLEQYLERTPWHKDFLEGNDKIVFHGRLSHLETLEYVKKANYSCFFREDDRVTKAGFPTKLAEAISCGTPVLTNNLSNLDEYVKSEKNGVLMREVDIDVLTRQISQVPFVVSVEKGIFDLHRFIKSLSGFIE